MMRKTLRRLRSGILPTAEFDASPVHEQIAVMAKSERWPLPSPKARRKKDSRVPVGESNGGQTDATAEIASSLSEIVSAPTNMPVSPKKSPRPKTPRSSKASMQNGYRKSSKPGSTASFSTMDYLNTQNSMQLCGEGGSNGDKGAFSAMLSSPDIHPRDVRVYSSCSMGSPMYQQLLQRPGVFNLCIKARNVTSLELEEFPARLALTDAITHFGWMAEKYETLYLDFPDHPWNEIMIVEADVDVSQMVVDAAVTSLYCKDLHVEVSKLEEMLRLAKFLQCPVLMDTLMAYMRMELIPKQPAACFYLGSEFIPPDVLADNILAFFKQLQWDGAVSQAMLHDLGIVLEHCSNARALDFLIGLTKPPALISTLQVASMAVQLSGQKREVLLSGLKLDDLSMADVQSLLHWANNRQTNRMRLADSAILWKLFYNNISSSLIPIEHLTEILGPKAAQMKLWDLPLAHIPREPGQYLTRRSGWLHLPGGQSFCMEAVFNKGESGSGWGLFCNPDSNHAFNAGDVIKMCAIQQGQPLPIVCCSPDIMPHVTKKAGLGMGYENILSGWAENADLVWRKDGELYLTLGLYIDLNDSPEPTQLQAESDDAMPELRKPIKIAPAVSSGNGFHSLDSIETPIRSNIPVTIVFEATPAANHETNGNHLHGSESPRSLHGMHLETSPSYVDDSLGIQPVHYTDEKPCH